MLVVPVITDVEHTLLRLDMVFVITELAVRLLKDYRELGILRFHVVCLGQATTQCFNVVGIAIEFWTLLVDPERCHHTRVILVLGGLQVVNGCLPVSIAWDDSEPASCFAQNSQDSGFASQFIRRFSCA